MQTFYLNAYIKFNNIHYFKMQRLFVTKQRQSQRKWHSTKSTIEFFSITNKNMCRV